MFTDYEEVVAAGQRLRQHANTAATSPYAGLDAEQQKEQVALDEKLINAWAIERLFGESEIETRSERPVQCFVCYTQLGYVKDAYPAVVAEVTGNYGSTVYDPSPWAELSDAHETKMLYLYICDMCLTERRHLIVPAKKEYLDQLSQRVSLPYETITNVVPELRRRYEKHVEWCGANQ